MNSWAEACLSWEQINIKVRHDPHYSMSVKHIALILDNTVGMEKQMNYVCMSYYHQILNKGVIGKYLNNDTWTTLTQAL